ncbi:sulfotransferase domain-containing protein [bacterium]|nr:sulfotransferase domain-containing protein [bacterium]
MKLPDFLVIGAPKCGTTSLHHYLSAHPEICMPAEKEVHYFLGPGISWGSYERGLQWYASLFADGGEGQKRGEASPGYAVEGYSGRAARLMSEELGRVKLIYMIRDPLRRAASHFLESYFNGHISKELTFAKVVAAGPSGGGPLSELYRDCIYTSCYGRQLEIYLGYFDRKDILVVEQEDLLVSPSETMGSIQRFIGVATQWNDSASSRKWNVSAEKRLRRFWAPRSVVNSPLYRVASTLLPSKIRSGYRALVSKRVDIDALTRLEPSAVDGLRNLFDGDKQRLARLLDGS